MFSFQLIYKRSHPEIRPFAHIQLINFSICSVFFTAGDSLEFVIKLLHFVDVLHKVTSHTRPASAPFTPDRYCIPIVSIYFQVSISLGIHRTALLKESSMVSEVPQKRSKYVLEFYSLWNN